MYNSTKPPFYFLGSGIAPNVLSLKFRYRFIQNRQSYYSQVQEHLAIIYLSLTMPNFIPTHNLNTNFTIRIKEDEEEAERKNRTVHFNSRNHTLNDPKFSSICSHILGLITDEYINNLKQNTFNESKKAQNTYTSRKDCTKSYQIRHRNATKNSLGKEYSRPNL
uniref:Uncharacterized protein n=1 Tax=Rhizophora mucronata TaxID=61149 RepID=A0A2P2PK38_RHIMU